MHLIAEVGKNQLTGYVLVSHLTSPFRSVKWQRIPLLHG